MISSIVAVYRLILPGFRLRFYGVFAVSIVVALLEVVGVASVLPLVAIVIDPETLTHSRMAVSLLAMVGMHQPLPPVYVVGVVVIALLILANLTSLFLNWWSIHFANQLGIAVSERVGEGLFRRPFTFFMAHPAAELANQMCSEVARVTVGGILQFCLLMSRAFSLLVVLVLLLIIAPLFTSLFFAVTAAIYVLIYRLSTRHVSAAGKMAHESTSMAMHRATEMFGLAREVLLRGEGAYLIGRVRDALVSYYRADELSRVYQMVPKYALEVTAVAALLASPIYHSYIGDDVRSKLPFLATFAYAGFRMLPMVQQVYGSFSLLRYYEPAARHLANMLEIQPDTMVTLSKLDCMPAQLEFREVDYTYAGAAGRALSQASFSLARGERVAIVGASGAGKSTLVDLVLGLLTPTAGTILIDSAPRTTALAWAVGAVGYVPQTPLVLNDSIARNIAFGYGEGEIDRERCTKAARAAGIYDVIAAQKTGFEAVIGVDKLNFSGGERQRLAIARALYAKPSLLVLDEPGSALDPPTSQKLFELLCGPTIDATVLVITHDIEHLQLFDRIVYLDRGRVVAVGTYDELAAKIAEFRTFTGDAPKRERRA
ncbi:MAG: ABC transporter ATP-binding protein [Alphaproteobacteria bacterium]|nr:ABC transporter ATP-binding protein [Alphaproteobacteria bacterium]